MPQLIQTIGYNLTDEQVIAYKIYNDAIRRKILIRPNHCSKCEKECTPDGHHKDYNKPLEVVWLCKTCHSKEPHRNKGRRKVVKDKKDKRMTVKLNEEAIKKLDEISLAKYRGSDRTKAIRWLIEDEWERMQETKKVLEEAGK